MLETPALLRSPPHHQREPFVQGSVLDRPNASAKRFGCHRERSMATRDMPWLQLHGGHPDTCRYGDDPVDALYGLQSQDVACRVLRVRISRRCCRADGQPPSGQVPPLAARWSRPAPTEIPRHPGVSRVRRMAVRRLPRLRASRDEAAHQGWMPLRLPPIRGDASPGGRTPGIWRNAPWPRLLTTTSWSAPTA